MYLEMLYSRYGSVLEKQAKRPTEKQLRDKERRRAAHKTNRGNYKVNKAVSANLPLNVTPHEIEKQLGKATLKEMQAAVVPGSQLLDVTKLPENVLRNADILDPIDVMGRRITDVEGMLDSSKKLNQDVLEGYYGLRDQNASLQRAIKYENAAKKKMMNSMGETISNLRGEVTDLTGQNSALTKSLGSAKSSLRRGKIFRDIIMRPKGLTQRIGSKFIRNPKTALALSALGLLGAGGAGAGITSALSGNE